MVWTQNNRHPDLKRHDFQLNFRRFPRAIAASEPTQRPQFTETAEMRPPWHQQRTLWGVSWYILIYILCRCRCRCRCHCRRRGCCGCCCCCCCCCCCGRRRRRRRHCVIIVLSLCYHLLSCVNICYHVLSLVIICIPIFGVKFRFILRWTKPTRVCM